MDDRFHILTGEFIDAEREHRFVDDNWTDTARLLRNVFLVGLVLMAGVLGGSLLTDDTYFKTMPDLVALRTMQLALFAIVYWQTHQPVQPGSLPFTIVITELVSVLVEARDFVAIYQPVTFEVNLIEHLQVAPVMVLIVFLMYTLIPNRFYYTMGVSLFALLIFTGLALLAIGDIALFGSLFLLFGFINFVGIAYGRYFNKLRRGEWLSRIELIDEVRQRKAAEASAVTARETAEHTSSEKSKFIYAVGHDLIHPVSTIGLLVDSLTTAFRKGQEQEVVGQLERVLDNLKQLAQQLMDLGRLSSGSLEFDMSDFPVAGIFDNLEHSYQRQAEAKGLTLRMVGCSQSVHSDPVILERILANLVENAIKYTQRGKILVGCRRRQSCLEIVVLDTGIGIPIDQQTQIFTEYHRLTRGDGIEGLGLGLSIVNQLAELLGHEVSLVSSSGKGSCFSLKIKTLP